MSKLRLQFSPLITATGVVLALAMVWASHWQWRRHLEKKAYIAHLEDRLREAPAPLATLLGSQAQAVGVEELLNRQVLVSGTYDFEHEVALRNRSLGDSPGVHAITPLRLSGSEVTILVDRGFVPLKQAGRESRRQFQSSDQAQIKGLVKEAVPRRWPGPADPPAGEGNPWVDAWLRPDVAQMAKQLPYPVLPYYLELVPEGVNPAEISQKMIKTESGQDELLLLGMKHVPQPGEAIAEDTSFPVPAFSTIIPAGRHLGYVFEWAVMALVTLVITFVVQIKRRPRRERLTVGWVK